MALMRAASSRQQNVTVRTPSMTTVTKWLCIRCNSDVTSLLSGTSIKVVVAYISDYGTKPSLKIYHIFNTIWMVLERNTVNIGSTA